MSYNQLHGLVIENLIRERSGLFKPGAVAGGRSSYDIAREFDRGLVTNIKATGNNTVGLADARAFWRNDDPSRLLVCRTKQVGAQKRVYEAIEFFIERDVHSGMIGNVSYETIEFIHDGIHSFGGGEECAEKAREWVKRQINAIRPDLGIIRLAPKIDWDGQRRLQCTVTIPKLKALCDKCGNPYRIFSKKIVDLPLPFSIDSTPREVPSKTRCTVH